MQYLFTGPLFLARTKKRRVRRKTRNLRAKREGETFFLLFCTGESLQHKACGIRAFVLPDSCMQTHTY